MPSHPPESERLRARLDAALGSQYTIHRELGGGGMSRTYVAHDVSLDRDVVVKVLAPELAQGLSVDRFHREVHTAAKLQHPHIVPVLATGTMEELPWFTMPFVDGESLRQRLTRGAMPIDEAVDILRDVARALLYAHQRGIVHRDIKPDNVLLTSGTATVTDFGIAKAITASRPTLDGTSDATLTQAGMALGTPAYMSPEQAAGDTTLDHRADLYAFGAMAWEMLGGQRVFGERPSAAMLIAHLTETPADVRTVRPEVPAPLAELINDCLAKLPTDRPADASAVLQRLAGASATPSAIGAASGSGRRGTARDGDASRRRVLRLTAIAAVVIAGALGALRALGVIGGNTLIAEGTFAERERLVVADFKAPADDTLLGATVAEALRTDLAQSPYLSIVTSATARELLARMNRDTDALVLFPIARDIALREGSRAVVDGELVRVGTRYVVTARLVSAVTGEELAAFREEAADENELLPALGRISRSLRQRVGESVAQLEKTLPLERVTTSSIDALRLYAQARRYGGLNRTKDLLDALERAVAADSTFAMAWRAIGATTIVTDPPRARAAYAQANRFRDKLSDIERRLLDAQMSALLEPQDYDRAITAYEQLLTLDPDNLPARANLAQMFAIRQEWERAVATIRPIFDQPALLRVGLIRLLLFGAATTRDSSLLPIAEAAYDSLSPRHESRWFVEYTRRQIRGDHEGMVRLADSVARSSIPPAERTVAAQHAHRVAAGRGQPAAAARLRASLHELAREYGGTMQSSLGRIADSLQYDAFFFEPSAEARAALRASITPARLAAIPPGEREWSEVLLASAIVGDAVVAERALAGAHGEEERTFLFEKRREFPKDSALAAIAAARWPEALRLLRAAVPASQKPMVLEAYLFGMTHDRLGQADSAIVWFARAATIVPDPEYDYMYPPAAMKRLAELHDQRGNVAEAVRWYEAFASAWRDAEPSLQPIVAGARERARALRARAAPG